MTTLPNLHRSADVCPEPLLIYLHGAGEIGGDTDTQVRKSGPWEDVLFRPKGPYHEDTITLIRRFHVVGFHLREGDWEPEALDDQISLYLMAHSSLDPKRVYITGISRGGRAALRLAIHRIRSNKCVSAVAAFCPEGGARGYSEQDIRALRLTPVFLFHCPEDDTVKFDGSAALHREIGSSFSKLRIVHQSELAEPKYPHVCWTEIYAHPRFYRWLLEPDPEPAAWPHMQLPYIPASART